MANDSNNDQKLKTFALMLKFNHDIFNAESFESAVISAVNDPKILLNFVAASIWQQANSHLELIGQFGQTTVNIHTDKALAQRKLIAAQTFGNEPVIWDAEHGLPENLSGNGTVYFCLKLPVPQAAKNTDTIFFWLLEYSGSVPVYVRNTAQILGNSIANALYFHKGTKNNMWRVRKKIPRSICWLSAVAMVTALMFIRVPETVNAEFMLKPTDVSAVYAWFDGPVAKCFKQNGEFVKKGDVIAEYDTQQLQYRVSMAKAALQELETELALEQQNSFTDQEKLGKVKLLEAKRNTLLVTVREAEWYLQHSVITAPENGILALSDGRAEFLIGKAVKTGDRLFEIYGGNGMLAEVAVNEENSSILQNKFTMELFLHTAPEKAIPAEVYEVAQYPELNAAQLYCYMVRAKLPENIADLRYGMRGIAKLSGEKITLGYYLFKNMILYFRSI